MLVLAPKISLTLNIPKNHGFQQFGMAAPVAATDAFNISAKSTRPLMSHFQFVASGMQTEIQPQAQK